MKPIWIVSLPSGNLLMGTASNSAQSAMAKAMMMDIPAGCRVDPYDDNLNKLPNPNDGE